MARLEMNQDFRQNITFAGATSFLDTRRTSEYSCRLGCSYNGESNIHELFKDSVKIFLGKFKDAVKSEQAAIGCSQRKTLFDVYLKPMSSSPVADGSSSSSTKQRMVGSVHGRVFKQLVQELDLQRPLQLQLKINLKEPLNRTIETKRMAFISCTRDKLWPKAFGFQMDLEGDPWTIPSPETSVDFTLIASITACPFVPCAGLGIVPQKGDGETAVMNKGFLEDQDNCDFTLVSGNGREKIKCHKMFLVQASPFFKSMIQTEMKEKTENKCKLDGSTKDGISALLKFLYYRNVEDALRSSVVAYELFDLSHKYNIPSLEVMMVGILLAKLPEWWDLDVALNLFLRARLSEDNPIGWQPLKRKAEEVLKMKCDELTSNSNTLLNELMKKDPNAAKELIRLLSQHDLE